VKIMSKLGFDLGWGLEEREQSNFLKTLSQSYQYATSFLLINTAEAINASFLKKCS